MKRDGIVEGIITGMLDLDVETFEEGKIKMKFGWGRILTNTLWRRALPQWLSPVIGVRCLRYGSTWKAEG